MTWSYGSPRMHRKSDWTGTYVSPRDPRHSRDLTAALWQLWDLPHAALRHATPHEVARFRRGKRDAALPHILMQLYS